ncbi:MAG: oxygen-dependent coproporphyrinogen oxidase [Oligoflexales bacterium]
MSVSETQKKIAVDFFKEVQDRLLLAFEKVDGQVKAERKPWQRPEGGGGIIGLVRGQVVEKAGANVSEVFGDKYPAIEGEHKDKPFFASGVSTITHMYNPYAPIGHMNVRLITVGDSFWFGGGADLTPFKVFPEDTEEFHESLKEACKLHASDSYDRFSKWCDEYFYIKHRKEIRGVGGIFFDYLKGDFDTLFPFVQATANAYATVFPKLLMRRKDSQFSEEEKEAQLYWRGRYAEYNLVYDRGTKFGLMTGGNYEAIFVSLPPVVKW